jgi:ribonucleoside-diphosphate reductase beta chain
MDPTHPDESRFVLFPIKHRDIWDMYKKAEASFWTAEELELQQDVKDYEKLTDNEKHFIQQTLAFFAASDGIVNENLAVNFMAEVQWPEARCFYGFQIMMENIHSEVYSQLIETFVKDKETRAKLFNGIHTFPSIAAKASWALHWTDKNIASFGERLVAFACVEGISFSAAFASIFYMKKRGLMVHGLGKSNEFIARDEGMHRDFACMLFKKLDQKPETKVVHQIIKECVVVETQFVRDALPVSLIGMNADEMVQYVEYVADSLCTALGVDRIFKSSNPFPWMENISLQGKTNFFEARVSEYSRNTEDKVFSISEDF